MAKAVEPPRGGLRALSSGQTTRGGERMAACYPNLRGLITTQDGASVLAELRGNNL
jgi:hypothetical protein